MSKIYQPPESPFAPLYQDCLQNALARRNLGFSTSSLSLVTIVEIPLVPNLFDTDGKLLTIDMEGSISTVAATDGINFAILIDGISIVTLAQTGITGLTTTGCIFSIIKAFRAGTTLSIKHIVTATVPSGTENLGKLNLNDGNVILDFTLPHVITIRTSVNTATSILSFNGFSASVI